MIILKKSQILFICVEHRDSYLKNMQTHQRIFQKVFKSLVSPYNIFFVFGPKMIFYHKQKKSLLKNKTYFMIICFPDQDTLVDSCAQIAIPVLISGYRIIIILVMLCFIQSEHHLIVARYNLCVDIKYLRSYYIVYIQKAYYLSVRSYYACD